jgi:restriction endonuclease S subunit
VNHQNLSSFIWSVPVETLWLGEMLRAMNLNQYSISAAQPGLSVEIVENLRIALPPMVEQTAIASFLRKEFRLMDALANEAEAALGCRDRQDSCPRASFHRDM